jgi:hypothetical protein
VRKALVALVGAAALLAAPGAAWGAGSSGPQNFTLISQSENSQTVMASGVINAVGRDVVVSDTVDRFVFPDGALRIRHTPKHSTQRFDPQTCIGHFTETGTFTVVSGTGAYQGATGSGTYRVEGAFFGTRTSKGCSDRGATVLVVIRATGHINLPHVKAAAA